MTADPYTISQTLAVVESGGTNTLKISVDPSATKLTTLNVTIGANTRTITIGDPSTGQCLASTGTSTTAWKYPVEVKNAGTSLNANHFKAINFSGISVTDSGFGLVTIAGGPLIAEYYNQQSSGTAGTTSAPINTWNTRTLNTSGALNNITGSSLSSNQFTLPIGSYYVHAISSLYTPTGAKSRIYNVTDAVVAIQGTNHRINALNGGQFSEIFGIIIVSGSTKTYRLDNLVTASVATGFGGPASGWAVSEIYAKVCIIRIG